MTISVEQAHRHLADFLSSTAYTDLPSDVHSHAVLVVQDTCGAILGGSLETEIGRLTAHLGEVGGAREATILAPGFRQLPASLATLINAAAGTALELDEFYWPLGHPAIHVLPAALAVAERQHSAGREFIDALVLGYEVTIRIAKAARLRPSVHTHGHFGTIGSAVACSKLLGFGPSEMAEAIGIASSLTLASPARTTTAGATSRNLFAGISSQIGLLATEAVTSGFTGLLGGLSDTFGLILGEKFDAAVLITDLGDTYEIIQNNFKFHAAASRIHPAIDAALEVRRESGIDPSDVLSIRVMTDRRAAQMNRTDPPNELAAKFSIPFGVATALVHGIADDGAFGPKSVADPYTRGLAAKVEVIEDAKAAEGTATVEVCIADGRKLEAAASLHGKRQGDALGLELRKKFERLVSTIFPDALGRDAWLTLGRIEACTDVSTMIRSLGRLAL